MIVVALQLNGRPVELSVAPGDTLLDALRVAGGATEVKRGCGEGVCGTCTVLLDGEPVTGCLTLAATVAGREITTVEGLDESDPVLRAFNAEHAFQCGWCTPGFVLAAKRLLELDPSPSDDAIAEGLGGNLCRCGSYVKILQAVRQCAGSMPTRSDT
jgi:aerobic-type carbon monoxide dehydrogenase small subunit (CoxS/CutS family)